MNFKKAKKPRKFANHVDDLDLTGEERDRLSKALQDEKFRELLFNYAQELSDPKVREENEKYLLQMEQNAEGPKNRKLMKPKPEFCIIFTHTKNGQPLYLN